MMKNNKIVPIVTTILSGLWMVVVALMWKFGWYFGGVLFIMAVISAICIWYQSIKLKIWRNDK